MCGGETVNAPSSASIASWQPAATAPGTVSSGCPGTTRSTTARSVASSAAVRNRARPGPSGTATAGPPGPPANTATVPAAAPART